MSQEIINNSDSGLVSKSKINNNFSELYQAHADASAALQAALVAGEGIIINGVPGTGVDPFEDLLAAGVGISLSYDDSNRIWTITNTGGGGGGGSGVTVREVDSNPSALVDTIVFPNGTVSIVGGTATITGLQGPQGEQGPAGATGATGPQGPAGPQGDSWQEEFETVAKNLKSYPNSRSYTGARLDSVTYTVPGGTIIKTLNYTGDKLTSVVLSGDTPSGIELTKTNTWTGDNLTGVAYS